MEDWNFFTNYGHIIFVISSNPQATVREIASQTGITERATQKIISDLEKGGFIKIKKEGRNNIYKINGSKKLRHNIERHCRIDTLIEVIKKKDD